MTNPEDPDYIPYLPEDRPRRADGRKVIETIHFGPDGDKRTTPDVDIDLDLFTKPTEGREYFYEYFLNMRAPASGPMPSVEVFNAAGIRIADAMWDFGYRRIEEEQICKWIPSAGLGGRVSEQDEGTYIYRDENGEWPSMNPIDYIDPDHIEIVETQDDDGKRQFRATHVPSGRYAVGKSRVKAQRLLLAELEEAEDAEEEASEPDTDPTE